MLMLFQSDQSRSIGARTENKSRKMKTYKNTKIVLSHQSYQSHLAAYLCQVIIPNSTHMLKESSFMMTIINVNITSPSSSSSGGVHRHERPPSRLPRQHVLLFKGKLQGGGQDDGGGNDTDFLDNDNDCDTQEELARKRQLPVPPMPRKGGVIARSEDNVSGADHHH